MIVYGDPSEQESFRTLVERLEESLSVARQGSLDDTRSVLIQAGMLEQGAEDGGDEGLSAPCRAATDRLAEAFLALYGGEGVCDLRAGALPDADSLLTLKIPEGFAFYALYPEGYVLAAERWRADHPAIGKVVVVGVRSIGTTLSAVVAATLRARGVDVDRLTLRPTGHPFAREARLTPETLQGATYALIVDEGPGLSGSSMAAAAQAVLAAGIARERIAFLPGHGNDPGGMASETVRRWWREVPRYVVPTESLRWQGHSLEETLADHAGDAVAVEELTGGRWRAHAYASEAEWPAAVLPFERRKLLVTRADGSRVLYKFVGLSEPRAVLGFASFPWVEGVPLTQADSTPELLAQIGRHIAAVAGPPLAPSEAEAAAGRLEAMLRVNLDEAGLSPRPPLQDEPLGEGEPSAGDYRLAPHEWRRLAGGVVVKTNRLPAVGDHTIVGTQPVAWDVAGAMVDWNLDERTAQPLLDELDREGIHTTQAERRFYRVAYAAFRMGQCLMFAGNDADGARLRRDAAFYQEALQTLLGRAS